MELRQLRYFIAVAEAQSFTRAAERLHIAQPALSVQVRRLEDELGVDLLDRSRRAIRLTAAGDIMLAEARRLLGALSHMTELARQAGSGDVGRLAIGFVPSAANEALPPILRRYRATHPGVALSLREMPPDLLVRGLHEGRLDVAFLYLPFDDPTLSTTTVAREAFVAALPADHPLATGERLDVARLAGEPFILPARHGMPGLHAEVLRLCREAGFSPRPVQEDVWLVQTIIGLVAAGIGVALLPSNVQALRHRDVAYKALAVDAPHAVELAAVWRRDHSSPVLLGFLEELAAATAA
jgi:DNA-binding transcriptional LysR family regulator